MKNTCHSRYNLTMTQTPEISVAPMMDWTDRHCRYFLRLIAPHVKLYTEMVTTGALLHGDAQRFMRYDESEHPVALQLGGSDPQDLAACAEMGGDHGYDEINLNCGCPSDRVQKGKIGAILMTEPDLVGQCVSAMSRAVNIPVTIKCRIGVDEQDDLEFLDEFVDACVGNGAQTLIIHARKCWLKGLSPKQNREVPKLNYDRVFEIKQKYPQTRFILNGGITDLDSIFKVLQPTRHPERAERTEASDIKENNQNKSDPSTTEPRSFAQDDNYRRNNSISLDGCMIGREAYQNPYFLTEIERKIFGNHQILGREKIARAMMDYAAGQAERYGTPVKSITRHMMGLYHHQKGAKNWRRALSEYPHKDGAGPEVIEKALKAIALAHDTRISA